LRAAGPAEADAIAVAQDALVHRRVVDERPEARAAVADDVVAAVVRDLGVLPRDVAADDAQIALAAAADREGRLVDPHHAPAGCVAGPSAVCRRHPASPSLLDPESLPPRPSVPQCASRASLSMPLTRVSL